MGAGVSQQQVEEHLARQERLVGQLQAAIARNGGGSAASSVNFASEPTNVLPPTKATDSVTTNVDASARRAEKRKKPSTVDVGAEEKALGPNTWVEPTEEEEKALLATKPWLAHMAPPTGFVYGATDEAPAVGLRLEHVYGMRTDAINAVFAVGPGHVLYTAATVGIVHDTATQQQAIFQGHNDDILCAAYHAGRGVAATGDQGKIPAICVWDTRSGKQLAKIAGTHGRSITTLSFSPDGTHLVATGLDDQFSIAVYDWLTSSVVASASANGRVIASAWKDAKSFVTVGVDHIAFWKLEGSTITSTPGLLGDMGRRQTFISVAFTEAHAVVGTQSGELYFFNGNAIAHVVDAHQGAVNVVKFSHGQLFAGGSDGYVTVWNPATRRKVAALTVPDDGSAVRSLDAADATTVLVGSVAGKISSLKWSAGAATTLVAAHHGDLRSAKGNGEINGLAAGPDGDLFVSAGEDGVMSVWSAQGRRQVAQRHLSGRAQCLAWSPDGKFIALGLQDGRVAIFDEKLVEIKSMKNHKRRITCVRFSPSGALLAVGSADNCVDLYAVASDFERKGSCTGPASVITQVDFSADEAYLQATTQEYDIVLFDVAACKPVENPRSLRDVKWATWSSILGWNVQGIWPLQSDGSDVDSVAVSNRGDLIAVGDATGGVRLFRYPCVGGGLNRDGALTRRPECHRVSGHSEHVTQVQWLKDQFLITAGGGDLCLFQWRVEALA